MRNTVLKFEWISPLRGVRGKNVHILSDDFDKISFPRSVRYNLSSVFTKKLRSIDNPISYNFCSLIPIKKQVDIEFQKLKRQKCSTTDFGETQ